MPHRNIEESIRSLNSINLGGITDKTLSIAPSSMESSIGHGRAFAHLNPSSVNYNDQFL
jgi:hypothetical protein